MASASSQPRKRGTGVSGQFDAVTHAESATNLAGLPVGPGPGALSNDELSRRDREVAELELKDDEVYHEHPPYSLRRVYADELLMIRAGQEAGEPRFTHEGLRPYWDQKVARLEYLTGQRDTLPQS